VLTVAPTKNTVEDDLVRPATCSGSNSRPRVCVCVTIVVRLLPSRVWVSHGFMDLLLVLLWSRILEQPDGRHTLRATTERVTSRRRLARWTRGDGLLLLLLLFYSACTFFTE
jgi:hypothetical protein